MYRYYIIAIAVVLFDQWTKWLIVKNMELGQSITLIDGFLSITSHRNKGAAWGILQDQMIFFYIITVIVVIGLIYYLHKHTADSLLQRIAIGFILGGAIGNFIDRLFRKEVVDFIDVMIFTYDYPIFNVADSFLFIGVVIFLIATFYDERKKKGRE
jgi:signal peptidase II